MQDKRELLRNIPASIQNLAEAEQLGEVITVVDTHKNPLRYAFTIFFIGLLVITIITISTLGMPFLTFNIYVTSIAVMLVLLFLLAVVGYSDGRRRTQDLTVVYDRGMIAIDRGQRRLLRWNKIYQVFRGELQTPEDSQTYLSDIDTMKILDQDKHVYQIGTKTPKHLRARVCDAVERGLVEGRLGEMVDAYKSGGELLFGKLKLSMRGFDDGEELLLWRSVEQIEVGPEQIVIRMEGRTSDWYRKWLPEVPNACLLREVVAQVRPSK